MHGALPPLSRMSWFLDTRKTLFLSVFEKGSRPLLYTKIFHRTYSDIMIRKFISAAEEVMYVTCHFYTVFRATRIESSVKRIEARQQDNCSRH